MTFIIYMRVRVDFTQNRSLYISPDLSIYWKTPENEENLDPKRRKNSISEPPRDICDFVLKFNTRALSAN